MKQKKETKLLSFLQSQYESDKFQLIEKQDILSTFDKNTVDEAELENMLISLERQGYLKIKYEDDNVYCLCVMKKNIDEKREQKSLLPLLYILSAIASFLGGMLGAIVSRFI